MTKGSSEKETRKRIDKYYWLDIGYKLVDGGLERAYGQIKAINQYVNGLLATYVLATVIDAVYLELDAAWKIAIILLPVIVIKLIFWFGTQATLPKRKIFAPDVPDSAEATYWQYFDEAMVHVAKLKRWALIATLLLLGVLTVVTYWTVDSKRSESDKKDELVIANKKLEKAQKTIDSIAKLDIYYVNTKLLSKENQLLLQGVFPKTDDIALEIQKTDGTVLRETEVFLIPPDGRFQKNLVLNEKEQTADTLVIKIKYHNSVMEDRVIFKKVAIKNE
ncbi:MAG: hypothetical protein AAFP76_09425 [Bacteroidota bacterium]